MSLANDYRPKDWDDVVEQGITTTILRNLCNADNLSCRNFLLTGPAGTGKAQPMDSLVLTPNGFIHMGDVRVGTVVFTHTGAKSEVVGVYPQGVRPIYEITLSDRTKIRVSDEHLNVVYRYNTDKKQREDFCLNTKDLIALYKKSYYKLRMDLPIIDWDSQDLPIDPYLLGVLIGDGSLSGGNMGFCNAESDIINRVNSILLRDWNCYLNKMPGDNYDYRISPCEYTNIKYTFMFHGIEYVGCDSMCAAWCSAGLPYVSHDTIAKIGNMISNGDYSYCAKYGVEPNDISCIINPVYGTSSGVKQLKTILDDLKLNCKSIDKHIPKQYLNNSYMNRLALLQGLIDTDGHVDASGAIEFSTSSKTLSDDFAYLVRSFGIRDTISIKHAKYKSQKTGEYVQCNDSYRHFLKVPSDLQYCLSIKHNAHKRKRQHEPHRNIVSIEYVGDMECQCIYVAHPDHTYISDGFIPTHNTTISRLMATMLNGGEGEVIEVDAASHSGAEATREIVEQAKTFPLIGKYKCIVLDECVTGDVEILTDQGFKRFDACDGSESVAQYTDDGNIEFVLPTEWIKNPYSGDLIQWNPRQWCSVRMTPNHVQPIYYTKSHQIKDKYISDVKFNGANRLIVAGKSVGTKTNLTAIDRLAIASQADGTIQQVNSLYVHWSMQLSKQRKIDRFIEICKSGNIPYTEIKARQGCRRFTYNLPLTTSKLLSTHFNLEDFSYSYARDFVDEIVLWDGYQTDDYVQYVSTVKENCDFVSAVACLGGYSARQRVQVDNRKDSYKDCYKVFMYDTMMSGCQRIGRTVKTVPYDGYVYCVKVPSHKIVVRSEGFVFITGNCHALSSQSFQVLLKVLEESPAKTVWFLCTTNPEKIPKTVTSRVQQFQLSKISLEGIEQRIKYVLDSEIAKGRDVSYTPDGINFIAKLAQGGMRDALTQLDTVLAFSNQITSETVASALNLSNYDDYFALLSAVANHDNTAIVDIVDRIYNSGVNFIKWFEDFNSFVMNIIKYILLQDIGRTMIPSQYEGKLSKYNMAHYSICLRLSNVLMNINNELRNTNYLQETVLARLCTLPPKTANK